MSKPAKEPRHHPLTKRKIRAAVMALDAMLAGIEGEGDWDPDYSADDLRAAIAALEARLRRLR